MAKTNVFCKVKRLDGKTLVYQFPNDLREAMLESYRMGELKDLMVGSLIVIPTTRYRNNHARLTVGLITKVFTAKRSQYWRTRGQFLTRDNWQGGIDKTHKRFMRHDHSFINQWRIRYALHKWLKTKGD